MQSLTLFSREMFQGKIVGFANILIPMRIEPRLDEATEFVTAVNQVIQGIQRHPAPSGILLIQVDNWFGSKWLGFSGKALGAFGVWNENLTIPPFVPNRIVSQRRFLAPLYKEVDPGPPIHRDMTSDLARRREISQVSPNTALFWYSANSRDTGRGSLLAYIPEERESYWSWYAAWADKEPWQIAETAGIRPADLAFLMGLDKKTLVAKPQPL